MTAAGIHQAIMDGADYRVVVQLLAEQAETEPAADLLLGLPDMPRHLLLAAVAHEDESCLDFSSRTFGRVLEDIANAGSE